ncbi:MAG: duf726 domain-containing protein [Lasallia pustulata]|uniref:Duf726 domain-containing protein n=1 Tax=Lasallia pustulata TaxID=136370 RepID=A0A5M8Q236_9LECA|nr:MAG: duf726 domain-containing protein [Lasallia pustulata]
MFKHVPWASHEEKPAEEKHHGEEGQSLTTVLDAHSRGELTLLIASATASMRKTIESNFDPSATLSRDFLDDLTSEDDKILNPNIDPGTVDVEAYDRERKLREQREKELSEPKTRELHAAALKFFDDWREGVIQRVGEVVNSKEKASSQMMEATTDPSSAHTPSDKKINTEGASTSNESSSSALKELYPPISTRLAALEEEKRILILHSMLLLLLSLEHYIAPSRILLLYLTSSLHLGLEVLTQDEEKVAKGLLEAAKQMSAEEETAKKAKENESSRKWKVGLASVAGAAIIGVTGGLAAPLVAAGVGSVMGGLGLGATAAAGYLGSVAGSTVIVGGLFGAYGGRMTGQMMDNYAREVEDFAFLPVRGSRKNFDHNEKEAANESGTRRLRVTIGISGWLTEKEEVVTPWRVVGPGSEVFALRYELEALMNLGNSITAMVSSTAWGYAKKEIIQRTIFAEMMTAMWPLGLLQVSRVVDNPFSVAKSRSEKAGEVLADALINKAQGERPVTLIGYSLGARVIYACLTSLATRRAFGLVESVVLIGAPTPSTTADWRVLRSVVAGRLVNVYSENDYVLGFLYRTSSIQYGVAGLQKIEGLPSVENVDVSETVSGHLRYRYLVGSILKKIGFEDVDGEEVRKEEEAMRVMEEEEKRRRDLLLLRGKGKGGKEGEGDAEKEAEEMQKEVEEKTQKSLVQRTFEQLRISKA